jgi:hypothetical protein
MKQDLTGKILVFVGIMFFLSFMPVLPQENQNGKFSIFAGGGLSFINGSDLKNIISSRKDLYSGTNEFFEWGPFNTPLDFFLEVKFSLWKSFSFGVGTGCILKPVQGEYGYESSSYVDLYEREYKFSAVPIVGSLYYDLFKNRTLGVSMIGGIGYYFGKLKNRYLNTWSSGEYSFSENLKSSTIGFHSGLSFEIKVLPKISFQLNGIYRFVNFKEWSGSYSINNGPSTKGDLYIYENSGIPEIRAFSAPPDFFTNPQKAKINLSGVLILFGLKIYL